MFVHRAHCQPAVTAATLALGIGMLSGCGGGVHSSSMPATRAVAPQNSAEHPSISFELKVSAGAAGCLPHASGHATVTSLGPVQDLHLNVEGLLPNASFNVFVLQVPKAPFGLAWYQGDVDTDASGSGAGDFVGILSIETFIVAPSVAPAPQVFTEPPFPDASSNPTTGPVQLYHLGVWFDSPEDATKAGCASTETPFNGTHTAGIQVLNTANFADTEGPLRGLKT